MLEIDQTPDAAESWNEVAANAPQNCVAQLFRLAQRLADVGRLRSPDQFNNEGDGFYAIKAECGLRAYGWYSDQRGIFVISHFVLKKRQKLLPSDKDRMKENKRRYELAR